MKNKILLAIGLIPMLISCRGGNEATKYTPLTQLGALQSSQFQVEMDNVLTIQMKITDGENTVSPDFQIVESPKNGELQNCQLYGNTVNCLYMPKAGYFGDDELTWAAYDGDFKTENAKVNITVLPSEYVDIDSGDNFSQNEEQANKKVDIVFVVDNSGSMDNEQTALQTNFSQFISSFASEDSISTGFNIYIAASDSYISPEVVAIYSSLTVKNPCRTFDGDIWGLSSSDAASDFQAFVNDFKNAIKVGTSGYSGEKMFASLQRCTESIRHKLGGDNPLAVVLVSDEPEQSGDASAQNIANHLLSIQPKADLIQASSIVTGYTQQNTPYANLNNHFSGKRYDILGSFSSALSEIGKAASNLIDTFKLSVSSNSELLLSTVKVYIDGSLVASSEYTITEENFIKFNNKPAAGAKIDVTYKYKILRALHDQQQAQQTTAAN